MTILTQENVIVNYRNVISITAFKVDGEIGDKPVTLFELSAKTVLSLKIPNHQEVNDEGNDDDGITLGVYSTEEKLEQVMKELTNWLKERSDYNRMFTMPQDDEDDEVKEE